MDEWGIDGNKMHLHPARVAQWLDADTWEKAKAVYPIYWEITTSAACNHRCSFCSVDAIGYPADLLEAKMLIARMQEAKRLGVKSVMFAGTGEPLLHKKISEITLGAVGAGLDVAFTTNGVLLDKLGPVNRCTWIKVSLNAGTPETYAKVHKAKESDWDKVWANIRGAVKRKGPCTIGVQCVVLPENFQEMRGLASMCADAGVDYFVLKPYSQGTFSITRQYEGTDYRKMDTYLQGVREFSNDTFKVVYRENAMKQESEGHHYDKCLATPYMWVYVKGDGDVFTCSAHLMDKRFCIGNINKQTMQEIWEGEGRRANWEMMKKFNIKLCRLNCRMNAVNNYLNQFSIAKHPTFI